MTSEISPRWSFAGAAWPWVRHTIIPLLAGAMVAVLEVIQTGVWDEKAMVNAFVTAVVAGLIRVVQVFSGVQNVDELKN